ncbi:MAG: hypothetical protein JNL96_24965 [Planctomycetaceae bacterium]|nr:hypothetical protein [Planctomycetaceae bacterium]
MRSVLFTFAVCSFLFASSATVQAQPRAMYNPSAAGNLGGGKYRPYSARTYSRHAINHGQILQHYSKSAESIPQATAQEHATEIRRNLDAFSKEVDKMPKDFENDPEAKKLIAEIRQHNTEASKHCGMLETECAKHMAAGGTVAKCCEDMLTHLRAADAAHDKLMKHLGIPLPGQGTTKPNAEKK